MLLDLQVKAQNKLLKLKEAAREFLASEEGDTNVISIIIILVIVIGLAVVFREKIAELVETLWGKVDSSVGGLDF